MVRGMRWAKRSSQCSRQEVTAYIRAEITEMDRRRQWHPTAVLLPRKSHGWRSLVGCGP